MKRQQSPHPMLIHRIRIRTAINKLLHHSQIASIGSSNQIIVLRQ